MHMHISCADPYLLIDNTMKIIHVSLLVIYHFWQYFYTDQIFFHSIY